MDRLPGRQAAAPPPNGTAHADRRTLAPWLRAALALLLVALVFAAYHGAPQNGFHLDDADNIVRHGAVHMTQLRLDALARAATAGFLPRRVLPNLSFALDWWRGGGSPAAFQFTNVVIHALAALAVLALLHAALRRHGAGPAAAWIAATLATAAWAVHPIQVQAVTYVVQRMTSMAALFMVVAVWSYVRARIGGRPRWFALTAIASAAAALSKENAWVLPALILLAEYALCRAPAHRLDYRLDRFALAVPLLFAMYVVVDLVAHGPLWSWATLGYANRDFTLAERLLTQPRVIAFHFGQILWPLPERFSIEHDFPLSSSLFQPWSTALSIAALLGWIGAGVWLLLRSASPVAGFFMLWVPATLVIESSVIALEMVFEHRMYLPSVGLAGLLALALARVLRGGLLRVALIAAVALVGGLLAATLARVPTWRTPLSLYEQASRHAPGSARTWTNLAIHYEAAGRGDEAIAAYSRALAVKPYHAIAYLNRGSSHAMRGRHGDAEADYRRYVALAPDDFRGPFALGALYLDAGRYVEAGEWLSRAAALTASSPLPHLRLAELHLATDRPDAAVDALRTALARDAAAGDAAYHDLLGVALARLGRFDAAIAAFGEALRLDAARPDILVNRGFAQLRAGAPQAALADFDRALTLRSEDARGHYGRAEALASLGRHSQALAAARAALVLEPGHPRAQRLAAQLEQPSGR